MYLFAGLFAIDATKVLDFLVKLLSQTKRKTRSGIPADVLMQSIGGYNCALPTHTLLILDRTLLYMLSRPIDRMNSLSYFPFINHDCMIFQCNVQ
jgi:hypothetical protein